MYLSSPGLRNTTKGRVGTAGSSLQQRALGSSCKLPSPLLRDVPQPLASSVLSPPLAQQGSRNSTVSKRFNLSSCFHLDKEEDGDESHMVRCGAHAARQSASRASANGVSASRDDRHCTSLPTLPPAQALSPRRRQAADPVRARSPVHLTRTDISVHRRITFCWSSECELCVCRLHGCWVRAGALLEMSVMNARSARAMPSLPKRGKHVLRSFF